MGWLGRIVPQGHLGVGFGTDWINVALVVRRGDGFEVTAVRALPAADRATLPQVVAEMGATGLPATFAVGDDDVRRQTLALPPLSGRDLARVLAREAGLTVADARAWRVLPGTAEGSRTVEVRTMPESAVRALVQEAAAAGLTLIDVVPHATSFIAAMTRPGGAGPAGELQSLIEVWDDSTRLVLARDGEYIYDRHLNRGYRGRIGTAPAPEPQVPQPVEPSGAPDFGEISLDDFQFDFAGAEEPAEAAASAAPVEPAPVAEPPPPTTEWERLAEELHRTHLFAKKNLKAGEVARTLLTGPYADDAAFSGWLAERMRMEVAPLARLRDDVGGPGAADPRMALPVGAALVGLAAVPASGRMVPAAMRRREIGPRLSYAATALLLFSLFSAGLSVAYEARALARQETDVDRLRQQVAHMDAAAGRVPQGPLLGPDGQRRPMPPGLAGAFPGADLLDALGQAMPARARLLDTTARWQGGAWQVTAQGEVLAPPVAALGAVGDLIAALDANGRFSDVHLNPVQGGGNVTPFEIALTLGGANADLP